MKSLINKYSKSVLLKNMSYLAFGRMLSQMIALIGAFYIPKLLGVELYGTYNIITNYVNIFLLFTLTGLNKVILREIAGDKSNSTKIIELFLPYKYIFSILGILLISTVLIFVDYEQKIKLYILFFSISILIGSINSVSQTIIQAYEKMKIIAVLAIIRTTLRVSIIVFLLNMGYSIFAMICTDLILLLGVTSIEFYYAKRFVKFKLFPKLNKLNSYLKPAFHFSLIDVLKNFSSRIDIFMLSFLTTPANVGLYALAYNLIDKTKLINTSISQALFPNYAKKYTQNKIGFNSIIKHALFTFFVAFLVVTSIYFFSEFFLLKIVGENFAISLEILPFLLAQSLISLTIIPFTIYIQVSNYEKYLLYLNILKAFFNISLNILFWHLFGLIGIAYSTIAWISLHLIFVIIVFLKIYKTK